MSPLGTDRTNSPSEKVTGSIPDSHNCHVLSDTWSRSDPVHLVQRSPAWVTASSERPFSPLGVQPACSERSSVWVIGRRYTVPGGATRGHWQIAPNMGELAAGGRNRLEGRGLEPATNRLRIAVRPLRKAELT